VTCICLGANRADVAIKRIDTFPLRNDTIGIVPQASSTSTTNSISSSNGIINRSFDSGRGNGYPGGGGFRQRQHVQPHYRDMIVAGDYLYVTIAEGDSPLTGKCHLSTTSFFQLNHLNGDGVGA
jgi:hypothetical protein